MKDLLGPSNKITIKLDSPAFSVGQDITGTLILDVHSKITLLTLEVFVYGKEKLWITLGEGDKKHHEKRVVDFLKEDVYLIGEPEGGDKKKKPPKTTIPPGQYEYKFSCKIPEDCPLPPSIEVGKSGIYYGVWGHVEDSSTWSTNKNKNAKRKKCSQAKEVHVPFTMIGKFQPQIPVPKPVNFTMLKKFMLSSKALEMNVKLQRDTWEPGETIKLLFSMKNETNKTVKRIESMLMPHWFQQLSKSKEFNSRMPPLFSVKWPDSGCGPNEVKQQKLSVELGQEVFPSIETAQIFRYHHVVMLRVFVQGESFIEIGVPITIQCKNGIHNMVELEPIVDFTEADYDVFGANADTVETSSSGCCVVL
mmetsp:Transcript_36587/g.62829  ORF Transcript_36587/g.62829 Transcript_36587/m.62829 type:complete len:363 (+) Transcript_36587:63-1151(+)